MQDHDYVDIGEAGAITGGVMECRHCGHDPLNTERPCTPAETPGPGPAASALPIDFIGLWDAVVVQHRQVTYRPDGYRVYLTEAQIDKLIEDRKRETSRETFSRDKRSYRLFEMDDGARQWWTVDASNTPDTQLGEEEAAAVEVWLSVQPWRDAFWAAFRQNKKATIYGDKK